MVYGPPVWRSSADATPPRPAPRVIIYDDRIDALTGVKLAVLSLRDVSPGLEVEVIVPNAPTNFRSWLDRHDTPLIDPPASLQTEGWDVKPTILLDALDRGADEAVWFDSDVIAARDIRPLLARFPSGTLVATEEYYWGHHQGTAARTIGLGLDVGRVFRSSVNSSILRVSADHRPLLEEWARIIGLPEYAAAQELPVKRRPVAFLGDQEILGGLLGSTRFGDLPLGQLRRGVDIAQCFGPSGFTVAERWRARRVLPPLVHAMGRKPWQRPAAVHGLKAARFRTGWENVHLDLTPYLHVARDHLAGLEEPAPWVGPVTPVGSALMHITSPALREVPLTVIDSAQRRFRRTCGIGQVPT